MTLQFAHVSGTPFYGLDAPTLDTALVQIVFLPKLQLEAETLSLEESWVNHEGVYLFLAGDAVLDGGLADRVRELLAEPTFSQTRFLWVENPEDALFHWRLGYLAIAPKPEPPTIDQYSVLDWRNYGLAIARGVPVMLTAEGFLLQPSIDAPSEPFALLTDYGAHRLRGIGAIALPFTGKQAGCLQFDLTLPRPGAGIATTYDALIRLDIALRIFFWEPAPPLATFNEPKQFIASHRYPLLGEDAEALSHYDADLTFWVSLDPLDPFQENRTYFAFRPPERETAAFPSGYRTNLGYTIHLIPQDAARLVFEERVLEAIAPPSPLAAPLYLVPSGDFAMSVPRYSGPAPNTENPDYVDALDNLLCGLSGVEFIKLDENPAWVNLLCFRPRQPAFVPTFSLKREPPEQESEGGAPAQREQSRFMEKARTAWAFVRQKQRNPDGHTAPSQPAIYFAQPDLSLLYGASSVQDGNSDALDNLFSFLEVPVTGLPDATPPGESDGPWGFPLLPYGGVRTENYYRQLWQAEELPNPISPYQQLEQQYINPERRSRIVELSREDNTPLGPSGAADVIGVTPQGFLTTYSSDYAWLESMVLAKDTEGNELRLRNLEQRSRLRDAFQSNQMFLVISDRSALARYLTGYTLKIQGWTFDFDAKNWRDDTVFIFKFFEKPLIELVADETTWTFKEDFNKEDSNKKDSNKKDSNKKDSNKKDSNKAPTISQRLVDLFEDARLRGSKEATPRDRENYEYLARAITQEGWSGIIALNVKVPPSEIPEELRALATGISKDDFFAQYMAIETTQVLTLETPDGNVLEAQKSSLFALIDYQDNSIPPIGPSGYAFQVAMLRVLFENSLVKAFSSEVNLTVDQLFNEGTRLLNSRTGRNLLIFKGTAENQDGKPKYTFSFSGDSYFAMPDSQVFDSINIVKANFTTDPMNPATPEMVTGRFTLWGQFNFRFLDKFDALSFGSSIPLDRTKIQRNSDERDTLATDLFQTEEERKQRETELETAVQAMEAELMKLQANQQVLPFSNVQITMTFSLPSSAEGTEGAEETEETAPNPAFVFDAGQLIYDLKQAQYRPNSLYGMFPLQLGSFVQIAPSTQPKGFMAVKNPLGAGSLPATGYGFVYDLNLGSMGALAGAAQLVVKVLLAWTPNTDGKQTNPQLFVGLQLPGIGGDVLGFPIQSVLKLSFKSLEFVVDRRGSDIRGYLLKMRNLALKILVLSLPPNGQTELILFGNPALSTDPSLRGKSEAIGWYAAYAKEPPPPDGAPPTGQAVR